MRYDTTGLRLRRHREIIFLFTVLVFISMGSVSTGEQRKEGKDPLYTLQIGAFIIEQNALSFKNKMLRQGFPAYIHESLDMEGTKIFRVRIGKFKTREEAETFGISFYEKERLVYFVLVADPEPLISPVVHEEVKTITPSVSTGKTESPKMDPQPDVEEALEQTFLPEEDPSPVYLETPRKEPPAGKEEVPKKLETSGTGEWPQPLSKIYTYRGEDNTTYITNRFDDIPEKFRNRLDRISIYPVIFVSFNEIQKILYVQMGDKKQGIRLLGVDLSPPSTSDLVHHYFQKNFVGLFMRFEYTPKSEEVGETILVGDLSDKHGKLVNLEMIRQGIAPCSLGEIPPNKRNAFEDAEKYAQEKKIGIWTVPQKDE